MVDATLTISIDRTSLGLDPLEFSGAVDSVALGIVGYQPPALQRRITYAPTSADVDGDEAVAASWQQALLGFDWVRDGGATEAQVQASYAEVAAAIAQFSYTVTTQVNGAPAQVWAADGGSMVPAARTYVDLVNHNPVYSVTIPVRPIPASA